MTHQLISGIRPDFAVQAGTSKPRNELGIGALMPWAGKLWAVSYIAHIGNNGGLYSLDTHMNLERHPESISGTFANRFVHAPSDSIVIGPHIIDARGNVRTCRTLADYRLAGTCRHLTDPDNKVYFLTMEGPFFEMDLHTLDIKEICNLSYELGVLEEQCTGWTGKAGDPVTSDKIQPHFKACHTAHGAVFVANNSYFERDHRGERPSGRLAEWDGNRWGIIRHGAFNEITGRENFGGHVFALGWDRRSSVLMVRVEGNWREYRLPKASQTFEHCWQTEWPRLREVAHERYLLDVGGMFYELSAWMPDGKLSGVRPVCSHLRVIPDFCSFAGLFVAGDNQVSPVGNEWAVGEPQSNFWFGHIDDLWSWGKPRGWGGPWSDDRVAAGEASAPYLMTGFDKKCLHVRSEGPSRTRVRIEIDFSGDHNWCGYSTMDIPADGYAQHVFPEGFSAHWVKLVSESEAVLTAQFHYT